uniref:Uncharacterized protein n=1 Tax=Oryza nivara TaxID=4536 RepID=A0A0E0HLY6_ORYNI
MGGEREKEESGDGDDQIRPLRAVAAVRRPPAGEGRRASSHGGSDQIWRRLSARRWWLGRVRREATAVAGEGEEGGSGERRGRNRRQQEQPPLLLCHSTPHHHSHHHPSIHLQPKLNHTNRHRHRHCRAWSPVPAAEGEGDQGKREKVS